MPHTKNRHNATNRHNAEQRAIAIDWIIQHRDFIIAANDDLAGAWTATKECGFIISLTQFASLRLTAGIKFQRGGGRHRRSRTPVGGKRYSNQAAV